jgi:hypothetical protein
MLLQSPDLGGACRLKELFYRFMKSKSGEEVVKQLKLFILSAHQRNSMPEN